MTEKDDLLEKRKEIKKKKPSFKRHDSHKNKKLGGSWRRPKGLQNKLRLRKRGYGTPVSTGWGSPKAVRGLHPSGYEPVRVHNKNDLEGVDADTQGVIIASQVGDRKRVKIIEEAQEKGIEILNLDGDEYLEKVEERLEKQQEEREKRQERKEERREAAKEAAEEEVDEDEEEKTDPEEKKEEEKEEMEKVVTKK